jgi:metal-dependent amidase/aminoacylase/carboxypeptidase family protein
MAIADAELVAAVAAQRMAIADTVTFVHAHPELAHEEHLCAAYLAGRLGGAGLRVEQDVAGLGTAFRAALAGGRAGRRVGIAALYDAVAAVRENGSIEEGTGLVLTGTLLFFADDEAGIERTALAVRSALPGADWRSGRLVPGIRPDARVTAAVADAFAAAGRGFEPDPPPLPFATDFGSISRRVPAALIGVGRPEGWAFHTDEGAAQFASTAGLDIAADMAAVLALATVRLSEPMP